jgi:hypothetical protein
VKDACPPTGLARALIRSLTRGTAIRDGVRYIHVGHTRWLAAQQELLSEIAEDGHSDTKFVRGAYGSGKSHFLSVVQDTARENGWMTSHVECRADGVHIDRFETLYPKIVANLSSSENAAGTASADNDGIGRLLERWTAQQFKKAGLKLESTSKPLDADSRLYAQLQRDLLKASLQPDFARAVMAFSRAHLADDFETTVAVTQWLRGSIENVRLPSAYLRKSSHDLSVQAKGFSELKHIGKGTAQDVLRSLLWLIKSSGYAGLVLCVDEVEELAKLGNRKRQDQALQALREFVDHAGGEGRFSNLCLYLAATPEMFEGPDYFPRYDALATRIQALGPELNWRAPVIDLDKTPLDPDEMLEVAKRIREVHSAAYGKTDNVLGVDFISETVSELIKTRLGIARPRLLARVLIDELERARQNGSNYIPNSDVRRLIQNAAIKLAEEAG